MVDGGQVLISKQLKERQGGSLEVQKWNKETE